MRAAFEELERRYPNAVFPDVYLLVGIMSSGGTTGPSGLLIGVEMYGRDADTPTHELDDWHLDVLTSMDALPHIIAHELVHDQQPHSWGRTTLLADVLKEGSADFVAELISGRHINQDVHEWARPREAEIWARFEPLVERKDGFHGFLYGGERPEGWPADVGYFLGYRIAQAYYQRAQDPDRALAEIVTRKAGDAERFLQESGYAERFRG